MSAADWRGVALTLPHAECGKNLMMCRVLHKITLAADGNRPQARQGRYEGRFSSSDRILAGVKHVGVSLPQKHGQAALSWRRVFPDLLDDEIFPRPHQFPHPVTPVMEAVVFRNASAVVGRRMVKDVA